MRARALWAILALAAPLGGPIAGPVAGALLAGCVPQFGPFQVVDDAGADGGRDAGERPDGGDAGPPLFDAGLDGGTDGGPGFVPSRVDVQCDATWTELVAFPPPPCDGRSVTTVASVFNSRGVALGRSVTGELLVAFNEMDFADQGRVRTSRFDEGAPADAQAGPTIEASLGEVIGTDLRIATEAPDIHHLALWYRSDFGNEVRLYTLRGDTLSPPEAVATGVGRSGVVDVAIDSGGRAALVWHDDAETSGRTAAVREREEGGFGAAAGLRTDGDARLVGAGAVSLVAGEAGEVHAAYQWGVTLAASAPSYSVGSDVWSTARTLDNRGIANRTSGVGVDVALVEGEPVVAYLDWSGGFAEIRLAQVRSPDPVVTTYLMGLVIGDQPGDHPIELAGDAYGGLHLLVADASAGQTLLQYHRQTRQGGERRWVVDTVAQIAAPPETVYVDMVLGPDRRPHIVYFDPIRGEVRYATARP